MERNKMNPVGTEKRKSIFGTAALTGKTFRKVMICTVLSLLPFSVLPQANTGPDRVILEDGADLLTQQEESVLYTAASTLSERTGWAVDLVTTDDAEGKEAQEYAEDYYMDHFVQDDGAACLIDMDNREIYMATSGNVIYYVTDDLRDEILDEAFDAVSEGDYEGTFRAMLEGLNRAYSAGIDSTHYTYNEDTGQIEYYTPPKTISPFEAAMSALLGLICAFGMGGIVSMTYRKKGNRPQYNVAANTKLNLRGRSDKLVNQFTTTRHIPRNPPPSSGGGSSGGHRSTTHSGSGGHSFGGGGRKF